MKKALLALLFALLAAYVCWPYYTVTRLEKALVAADQGELEKVIDFPAVRKSLKDQMAAKLSGDTASHERSAGANPVDSVKAVSAMLAGAVADKVVDSMVTPENVVRFLKLDAAVGAAPSMKLQDKQWHSPTEFSARAADQSRFKFRLVGPGGWRVVSLEPGDRLGAQVIIPR